MKLESTEILEISFFLFIFSDSCHKKKLLTIPLNFVHSVILLDYVAQVSILKGKRQVFGYRETSFFAWYRTSQMPQGWLITLTLTYPWVWWGRCEKNYLPKEEGRVKKKSTCSAPARPGARTRDLPRAR